jgi:hypothetical protein
MGDVLTVAEIESRFKSEWVLVEHPQTNESLEVLSGKVRFHSKDRDEVYRKAVELRQKRFAMLHGDHSHGHGHRTMTLTRCRPA